MVKIFPFIFILLWSSAFITTKPIIDNSDPFSALAFRFALVAFGFFLFCLYAKQKIFINKKNEDGSYKDIFLNDSRNKGYKTIYAKKGILIDNEDGRFFKLTNGRIINNDRGKITNFTFETVDFNLSKYSSKTTTYPKTQEASSKDLFNCIYYDFIKEKDKFKARYLRCNDQSIKNIKQEFLKRFYKPFYY